MPIQPHIQEKYEGDGFLVHDFGFDPALIEDCAAVTASLLGTATRVQDLWRKHACVRKLGAHPNVLAFLTELYARGAFPFQTLNFPVGTQQGIHADTIFFDSVPSNYMCGVWVALEDIDMDNGPLIYFAESQNRRNATLEDINSSPEENLGAFFDNEARNYQKTYGVIKKGQAIVWSANVLHGGAPILDKSRTRLSQVTHYFFKNCAYHTPVLANEKNGRPHWRAPYNFAEQKFMWGHDGTRRRLPRPRRILSDIGNNLLRRTPSWFDE